MKAEVITDKEQIKKILCHPEIFKTISGKNCPIEAEDFDPPLQGSEYFAGFLDGEIFAIMIYDEQDGRLKLHIQVLPEYRKEHAKEFARIALDYGLAKNVPLYADISDTYPNVIKFTESFGFKKVGKVGDVNILRYEQ
jgi:hypothetical protein